MTKQYDNPVENLSDGDDPAATDDTGNTWLTDDAWAETINWRWRKVIEKLMDGSRIYEAYATAYEMNLEEPGQFNVARAAGSRLLTNVNFRRLWDKVLAENGFNDQAMDMTLLQIIKDPGTPAKERINGIKHVNELRGRVVKRLDHTSKGDKIENPYGSLTPEQLRALAEANLDADHSADTT